MQKVLIVVMVLVMAVIIDILIEFKDKIMPKEEKIIKVITKIEPKKEKIIKEETTIKEERNISKVVVPNPEVMKLISDGNKSIDLSKVSPLIDKWRKDNICDDETSISQCMSKMNLSFGDEVFIRIFKLTAELEVWVKSDDYYQLLKIYPICKQSGYLGPKLIEGDKQGPEGFYSVTKNNLNPNSQYYLSFNIGFPNSYDRLHNRTGSALMVHGDCISVGCYAMGDEKIDEIYKLVESALESGQQEVLVHIFPFRMSDDIMLKYSNNQWYNFWGNLKEGYDYFEEGGIPPRVRVVNRRYEFE